MRRYQDGAGNYLADAKAIGSPFFTDGALGTFDSVCQPLAIGAFESPGGHEVDWHHIATCPLVLFSTHSWAPVLGDLSQWGMVVINRPYRRQEVIFPW